MAAFHARLPSHGAVDDTPTRPSSAAASFSSNLTSLKPPRTQPHHQPGKPSLSGMTSRAAAGLAPADLNRLDSRANNQPPSGLRPSSRASATALSALKASDLDSLFEQDDQAAAPIEADNTELARRRAEASFQREMEDLRNAVLSPSSASDVSLSRKPHRQQNSRESATDAQRRRQFDDETASSRSGTSASSYESLRIGLTGAAKAVPPSGLAYDGHPQQRGDDDDDDLTYVTLPRSAMTSPDRTATPGRPAAASAGPPPASVRPATAPAPSSASNLFSSPRPFVSSAGAGIPAASRGPFATGPNQAAGSPNRSSFERPSPGAHSFATTSTIAAAPSAPFAQRASPFAANPPLSSFRSPATGTSPANALNNGTPLPAAPHRPSPLGRNSPILASASPTATATSTPAQSRSFGASHRTTAGFAQMAQATGADRTTMTALPDRTGITDFLRSPERERQVLERERRTEAAASAGGPDVAQARRSAAQSSESNLAAQALTSLTAKLAALERDNAASAARVAELEARLAAGRAAEQSGQQGRQSEEEAKSVRREVEVLLGDERARREDLERVVSSLRAQNAHLDATLSAQKQTLDALRVSSRGPAPQAASTNTAPYALKSEVQDLKHALAALGYEVDGVRTVVEELLREKEERDAGKRWEAEEAERRADLQVPAPLASEGSVVTPEDHHHHHQRGEEQVVESVRSWVSAEEVEMLKREQREEQERQRRASAAVSSAKPVAPRGGRPAQHDFSIATSQDPTYVPSPTASSFEASEASFVSATSATTDLRSLASSVDEPDFARAERIFASAPTAHRERRRTSSGRPAQARRSSAEHEAGKRRVDRVVLLEEPSGNLCSNCHGRKDTLKRGGDGARHAAVRARGRDDGAEADEEDLAPVDEARERRKREHKAEKARREKARVEREARKEAERKSLEREEHRRTLEEVLDRLEEEFATQKKIYLELTAEYQSMSSRTQTGKRRALATHLKKSIDVLENKASDVKRYADALEDMYEAVHGQTCPQRNFHRVV